MTDDGIILVDKPKSWTSFDVVAKLRGVLKKQYGRKVKIGHTGTLDPLATGLMIIVTGSYCKKAQEYSKLDKTYTATVHLGATSTTDDEEGDKTLINDKQPSAEEVQAVLQACIGEQQQTPPAFSAIKIGGKRAYKMARAGQEVKIESRTITVYEITLQSYEYPLLKFEVNVSSGTYIRSLARDIGSELGTGAYLADLRRTTVGEFKVSNAETVNRLVTV